MKKNEEVTCTFAELLARFSDYKVTIGGAIADKDSIRLYRNEMTTFVCKDYDEDGKKIIFYEKA